MLLLSFISILNVKQKEIRVLLIAILFFLIAAGLGLVVLMSILQNTPTPKVFVYTHGGFALLGLGIIVYYTIIHTRHAPLTSLILFLIAALGGLILFVIDMQGKSIPKWLALIHPVMALIALLALVIFLLSPQSL